jgi:Tol biopolymer transport system component/DNA-binding winged helix-turn-helix (wHTH) protein
MSAPATKARSFRFSVFEVQTASQELRKRGLRLKLAGQPFQILTILLDKNGEVVTRDELRRAIWPEETWGDHDQRLNKAMNKVREVLGDSADTPRYIETIPKVGYRFLLPVEVHEIVADPPIPPTAIPVPPPPPTSLVPVPRRDRWAWAALGLIVLAAVALLLTRRPDVAPKALISRPLTTFVGSEHSPSYSPDGRQIVFAWATDGRPEDLYLTDPISGGARQLTHSPDPDTFPVFSPDGNAIAFRRGNGVWLLTLAGGEERKLASIESSNVPGFLAFTPNGKWIVSTSRGDAGNLALFAIDIHTGERHQLTDPPAGQTGDRTAVFSPDGRRMAFTRHTAPEWREIFIADFDAATTRCRGEVRKLTSQNLRIDQIAFKRDGKEILFAGATPSGGSGYLSRVDVTSGEVRELAGVRVEGNSFALAPDGKSLVVSRRSSESTSLRRLDLTAWKPGTTLASQPLLRSTAPDYSPDISPDGQQVVMSSSRSGTPQLWVFTTDQPAPKQLTFQGNAGASVPRWSPDGTLICFDSRPDGQSDIFVIEYSTGKLTRITNSPNQETRCSWSRDGSYVYYGSPVNGRMELFRKPLGNPNAPQERVSRSGGSFAVESPNGQWIYYSTPDPNSEIRVRRRDAADAQETTLATHVLGRSAITVAPQGLYYLSAPNANGATQIQFLRFDTNSPSTPPKPLTLTETTLPVHNALALSPTGKWLVFTELLLPESDLHLFTGLR